MGEYIRVSPPRRIYARFRFAWDVPSDASRHLEIEWLRDLLEENVPGVRINLLSGGEEEHDA